MAAHLKSEPAVLPGSKQCCSGAVEEGDIFQIKHNTTPIVQMGLTGSLQQLHPWTRYLTVKL